MKILDTIKAVRTVALSHLWCLDPLDWPQLVCVCVWITAGYAPSRHHTELESNSLGWIGTPSTPIFTAGPFGKPSYITDLAVLR